MDPEYISTLYTTYITLIESNQHLFDRIQALEQRLDNLTVVSQYSLGGNSNYYAWQFYSTLQ